METDKQKRVRLKKSKEKVSQSLIDDLLDTAVFSSAVEEELSLEVEELLKSLQTIVMELTMSREEALVLIRSAKTGSQIIDILDKISTFCSTTPEEEDEILDLEFAA